MSREEAKKVGAWRRPDHPARRAVVIAGMHRSGTSAVTRALSAFGAELPSDLMPPKPDNELGFWESSSLHAVHEELLASIGSSWDDVSPVPPEWFGSDAAIRYRARLVHALQNVFSPDSQLVAIKDPRICRLVPLWRSALADFGAEALWIIPVRNPLEVAFSLRARNGFSLAKSLLLWLRHLVDAEFGTRGARRTVVSFEALLADCQAVFDRMGRELELVWPRSTHAARAQAEGSLSLAGRHQRVRTDELEAHPDVLLWVKKAYEAFRRLEAGDSAGIGQLDSVRERFDEADEAFGPLVAQALSGTEEARGSVRRAEEETGRLAGEITALRGELGGREAEIAGLRGELGGLATETTRLNETVSSRDTEIGAVKTERDEVRVQLEQLRAETEGRLQQLAQERRSALGRAQELRTQLKLRQGQLRRLEKTQQQHSRSLALLRRERAEWVVQMEALEVQATESGERLAEASRRAEALARTEAGALHEIERMRRSLSWRITRPLRGASAALMLARTLASGLLRYRRGLPLGVRILSSPQRLRAALVIQESGLFDPAFYLRCQEDVRSLRIHPFLHFVVWGWREGRDPNPLFDTSYYLERYPDVARSSLDPLTHFIRVGATEGRDPHPLFATTYYVEQFPRLTPAAGNPLQHYLRFGAIGVRSPHPLFDGGLYLARYSDVRAAGLNPLVHYLEHGVADGRDPSPWFSTRHYLASNRDVADSGVNPLVHFVLSAGLEAGDPGPRFSSRRYLSEYADVAEAGLNPLVHYLTYGIEEGRTAWPSESGTMGVARGEDLGASPVLTLRTRPAAAVSAAPPTILCVSHVLPYPPRAGNAYRIDRMLSWLRQAGYRLVLVVAPLPGEEVSRKDLLATAARFGNAVLVRRDNSIEHVLPDMPFALAPLNGRRMAPLTRALGEGQRAGRERDLLAIDQTFCHDAVAAVTAHLQAALGKCVVLAEYIWMTRLFPLLGPDALKLVDTLDVFSHKRQKVGEFGVRDLELLPWEEAERLERADVVIAIQDEERASLAVLAPRRPVVTVGLDFDIAATTPLPREARILYVGSDNALNWKGLRDFLRFAWPGVIEQVADAELVVAGRVSRAVSVPPPGVRVLGPVDDLRPLYRDCRVVINPAVAGTGLKIKTVEALCHGRPVVTWPTGAEGLPPSLAGLCRIAVDWYDFQSKLVETLKDVGLVGFTPAEQTFVGEATSPERVYAPLRTLLDGFFERQP